MCPTAGLIHQLSEPSGISRLRPLTIDAFSLWAPRFDNPNRFNSTLPRPVQTLSLAQQTHSTSPLGRPTRVRRSVGNAACLWQRFLPLPTLSNQPPGRHAHLSRTDLRSAANVQANGVQYLLRQAAGEPTAAARTTAPFTTYRAIDQRPLGYPGTCANTPMRDDAARVFCQACCCRTVLMRSTFVSE